MTRALTQHSLTNYPVIDISRPRYRCVPLIRKLLQCRFLPLLSLFPLLALSPSFLSLRLLLGALHLRVFPLGAFLVVVSGVLLAYFAFEGDALRVLRGGDPGDVAPGVESESARNASHRDPVVLRPSGTGGRMALVGDESR